MGKVRSQEYYSILNVSNDATTEQINEAYKKMSLSIHPDRHQDPELKTIATEKFARLKEAHTILSNPAKRKLYDEFGPSGLLSGLEVGQYYSNFEDMKREYEKARRKEELDKIRTKMPTRGFTEISLNISELIDPYDDRQVELHSIVLQQTMDVDCSTMPLTAQVNVPSVGDFSLTGSVISRNGLGAPVVASKFQRSLGEDRVLEVKAVVGSRQSQMGFKLTQKLSKHSFSH
jgi:DnaJ homolog subfamily C member 11